MAGKAQPHSVLDGRYAIHVQDQAVEKRPDSDAHHCRDPAHQSEEELLK